MTHDLFGRRMDADWLYAWARNVEPAPEPPMICDLCGEEDYVLAQIEEETDRGAEVWACTTCEALRDDIASGRVTA